MPLLVTKAGGTKEPFSEEKVLRSIRRVGIPAELEDQVLAHIRKFLRPDISTREIYQHILEFLSHTAPASHLKFSLRESLMRLGPTGFPFEKYIARVLGHFGYSTEVDVILNGKCITHEVDVLAQKDGQKFMLECKYHNQWGSRTDAKVALYVKSRFDDLSSANHLDQGWLVTNTKCTVDAIAYSQCVGLKVISWGYPSDGSLAQLIESANLYPLTCQTTLTDAQTQKCIAANLVLCQDLADLSSQKASELGISHSQLTTLQNTLSPLFKN